MPVLRSYVLYSTGAGDGTIVGPWAAVKVNTCHPATGRQGPAPTGREHVRLAPVDHHIALNVPIQVNGGHRDAKYMLLQ